MLRGLLLRVLPLFMLLPGMRASASSPAPLPADCPYLSKLLSAADHAKLCKHRYWHTLLHYKEGAIGLRSLVDDPDFFLAPNGKYDPREELEATLRALFLPVSANEKHPICRFVARYHWLKKMLDIDESLLPIPGCEPFDQLIDEIRPESVTLIFPTSHMNSPASMYGHTLLVIKSVHESELLSYAVNYSALAQGGFGPLYIVKGLFGMYEGYFSILPYYAKIQEYSDINSRDIWEYPLDLSKEEIEQLIMHTYELEGIHSNYFFFKENCAYNLLFLLDAARPGLNLTDMGGWWVLPIDTIRRIQDAGLILGATYRPSKSTKIKHLASFLSKNGRKNARAVSRGEMTPEAILEGPLPAAEQATILDLASELLQYQHLSKKLSKETYQKRFLGTLTARSQLGVSESEERYAVPAPRRPETGHHTYRLTLGGGALEGATFWELRFRPAYHDLLDNEAGYKRGSQIIFCESILRYDSVKEKVRIQTIDLIDIVSLAPRDEFFKPTSWKVRTGFFRRLMANGRDHVIYALNTGLGRAYDEGVPGLAYALIETDLQVGGALENNGSVGIGGTAGLVGNLSRRWKAHLYGQGIYYGLGERDTRLNVGLGQNLTLGTDSHLIANVMLTREQAFERVEWSLLFKQFF